MTLSKRQRRQLIISILLLFISLVSYGAQHYGWRIPVITNSNTMTLMPAGTYRVRSVDDGDTIVIDMNGDTETVRFIGVDTPEIKDPRKPVQCFGRLASEFTKNLIGNNHVRLEADPSTSNRDRYNRLLRYVYLPDNRLVNAEIIKAGYGFAYTSFPFTKKQEFKILEEQAHTQNKGLWGNCQTGTDDKGYRTINPEN
jgi:micrococcal nuclease